MKKTYIKPYIAVETFQLDAAIAASCSSEGKEPLNYAMHSCKDYPDYPGLLYFGNDCDDDINVDGDGNDGFCYHGPTIAEYFMNS